MSQDLANIAFKHSKGFDIGIDIITLESLYKRQAAIKHPITIPHRVGFYILLYITSGSGKHVVDFQDLTVSPHSLLIISKHQVQQFDQALPFDGYMILITEDFLQQALFNLDGALIDLLFEPITTQAHCLKNAQLMLPHIESLMKEYNREHYDTQHIPILTRELGILLLKADRLRSSQLSHSDNNAESSTRLGKFRNLLELHYKEHWTAQRYADEMGFSKRTLGTLTRKHLNRSPKEVIDQRLVLETKRLLSHTDLTIKEIAFQLGFEDPSNINKHFKRVTGSSPSSFRQHP